MKNTLLKAKHVQKEYRQDKVKTIIIEDLDLDIFEKDFTVIMGPSGAGKSTLLYALSGMDEITSGEIWYRDQNISKFTEKQMAALRAKDFGFVFQQTHLVSNLSVFENIVVAGYIKKEKKKESIEQKVNELIEQMNLKEVKNHLPSQTSGGEAQRAAIARSVINQPGIIFADEPTGALNKANSIEVLNLLSDLNTKGQTVLMVTHDLRAAIRANRILYLEDGKIIDELNLEPYRLNSKLEKIKIETNKVETTYRNDTNEKNKGLKNKTDIKSDLNMEALDIRNQEQQREKTINDWLSAMKW